MLALLALVTLSYAMAATQVVTVSSCGTGNTVFPFPSYLTGCSSMGRADCSANQLYINSTTTNCDVSHTAAVSITASCGSNNFTYTCTNIDGTKAISITMYTGNACNGTATPLGVFQQGVCTQLSSAIVSFIKVTGIGNNVTTATLYTDNQCTNYANSVNFLVTSQSGCVQANNGLYQSFHYNFLVFSTVSPTTSSGVGTAFAPTMSSQMCVNDVCQCLNTQDYAIWTTSDSSGLNGYQRFPAEMNKCAAYCLSSRGATRSSIFRCGSFLQSPCPADLYSTCITACFDHDSVDSHFSNMTSQAYTKSCATCMAQLQNCTLNSCVTNCTNSDSDACHACTENNCGEAFRECAGINADIPATNTTNNNTTIAPTNSVGNITATPTAASTMAIASVASVVMGAVACLLF